MEIIKTETKEKTRMLETKWVLTNNFNESKIKPVSEMTEEEKQDEVIRRLKTSPAPPGFHTEMAMLIKKAIDVELLQIFKN